MAIPFLNNINLSDNELQNAKLQVTGTAPTSATGQIYYDSSLNVARYYDNNGWLRITDSSVASGTFVSSTSSGTNSEPIFTVELSATGTPSSSTFLRGDNTWASVVDTDTTYDLTGTGSSNGTAGVLLTGSDSTTDTVLIVGAGTSTVTRSGNTLTVTSNDQYDGTVTSVGLSMPSAFSVSNSPVTSSGTLTVAGAGTTSQYVDGTGALQTFPTISNYQYWTLSDGSNTTNITSTDTATFQGTTNETTVTESSGTITIGLPSDVTITNDLTVNGELTVSGTGQSSFGGQVTIPTTPVATTDAASKAYVDSVTAGGLIYQGGYNATTNTPDLDSGSNIAIEKGWTYTVTVDGLFFTEQVRVGDVLIAEEDMAANGGSALNKWTTVQNNIDLASASTVGIGNVVPGGSNTITAPYSSGTATIDVVDSTASQKGAIIVAGGTGISVAYNSGTATVTNTNTNSSNTFAATITDTGAVTHSLTTKDVIVQLYDTVTNETVYADVERNSTSQVTITFATTPTNSVRVLVQKIG